MFSYLELPLVRVDDQGGPSNQPVQPQQDPDLREQSPRRLRPRSRSVSHSDTDAPRTPLKRRGRNKKKKKKPPLGLEP